MGNIKPIAPSISKDTFCKALSLIREQEKEHDLVQKALCIVTDGPTKIPGFAKNSRNGYRNKTQLGLLTAPITPLL